MQRNKFSLKNVRRTLVASFSYIVLLVFAVLTINCGSPSKTQYYVPEMAATTAAKASPTDLRITDSRLPKAAAVNLRELPYVRNVCHSTHYVNVGACASSHQAFTPEA